MTSDERNGLPGIAALEADYELVRELGRDSKAVAYLARERTVDRSVVIRLVSSGHPEDDASAARLLKGAAAAGRLEHPNIVMLLGTRRLGAGKLALILQHVPGITLEERIRTSRMPYPEVERVLGDLGRALSYAHRRGVVHGNLTPAQVHLDEETGQARLAGFGMTRAAGPEDPVGEEVDGSIDVLTLGLVGYEMLTGEAPWRRGRPERLDREQVVENLPLLGQRRPGVPQRIRNAVEGALGTDPERRWRDVDAFLAALDGGRSGGGVGDEAEGTREHREGATNQGRRIVGPQPSRERGGEDPRQRRGPLPQDPGPWAAPPRSPRPGRVTRTLEILVFGTLFLAGGIALVHPAPERLVASALAHLGLVDADATATPSVRDPDPSGGASGSDGNAEGRPPDVRDFEFDRDGVMGEAVPQEVVVVGGRFRIGAPGLPLPGPVVVRVVDEDGVGVPGVEVAFEVTSGGGSVQPTREMTGPGGAASTAWTLGAEEGDQELRVAVVGSRRPGLVVEVSAQASTQAAGGALDSRPAGPPADEEGGGDEGAAGSASTASAMEILRGGGQEALPGAQLPGPLEVRVTDASGRPVPDAVVHFQVIAGGGVVSPTSASANAEGLARAAWTLGPEEGRQGVRASLEAAPSVGVDFLGRASAPRIPVRSSVVAGGTHSCSLRSDGTLLCWGANESGQLGDGSRSRRLAPGARVEGGPFAAVAAGVSHGCALATTGRLACWGLNGSGQLGDGSTTPRTSPVPVSGDRAWVSVSAGGSHTCALAEEGGAYCWGANEQGQLGNGSTEPRRTPVRVASSAGFRQVVTGWRHTCALDEEGSAHCWGSNESGEAGLVSGRMSSTPRPVLGSVRFTTLAAGNAHTCGVTDDGQVFCWGANGSGQLGDGTRRSRPTPSQISGSGTFVAVAAGGIHTCGLTSGGEMRCWGGNIYGQLGDGSTTDRLTPVPVSGGARFAQVHALGSHTCGRTPGDEVLCWGYNLDGQLGDGTRENRTVPTAVNR